jgi:amino acid transporter
VAKVTEESHTEFRPTEFFRAMVMALLVGAGFYVLAVAAVAYVAPWSSLLGKRFATAIAFEQALGARWPVRLILVMAMFGLFQCFNGNFVASSRMLFAFGRRQTVPARFGTVHQKFLTPSVAVLGIAAGTLGAQLLGDALLVPVTEVGSMASALGWSATCASFLIVERRMGMRIVTALGMVVSWMLVLMKVLPIFPGHFTPAEWLAFGIWIVLGAGLHWGRS